LYQGSAFLYLNRRAVSGDRNTLRFRIVCSSTSILASFRSSSHKSVYKYYLHFYIVRFSIPRISRFVGVRQQTPRVLILLNSPNRGDLVLQFIQNLCDHILNNSEKDASKSMGECVGSQSSSILEDIASSKIAGLQWSDAVKHARDFVVEDASRLLFIVNDQLQPINRLPNEILAIIFQYATNSLRTSHSPRRVIKRAPINVSHVSRLWREIALNSPRLWTTIHSRSNVPIHIFLSRSKATPLNIIIRFPHISLGLPPKVFFQQAETD